MANRPFLVFEFVQGQPLASLINGRALHVRRALEFGINLADALADAHAVDMIHGDIRPDTIMITPKDRAKFMNFGLSRFTAGGAARVTSGAPYVAPEELAGQDRRFAQRYLFARRCDVRDAHRPEARARARADRLERDCACRSSNKSSAGCSRPTSRHRAQSAATVAAEFRSVAAILDTRTEAEEAAGAAEPPRRRGEHRRSSVAAIVIALLVLAGAIAAWLMRGQ